MVRNRISTALSAAAELARSVRHLAPVVLLGVIGGLSAGAATVEVRSIEDIRTLADGNYLVKPTYLNGVTGNDARGNACYAQVSSLQAFIDNTPAGGICVVPAGSYEPAIVPPEKDNITIVGVGESSVIDGSGLMCCLLVQSKNVTLSGLKFVNGYAKTGDGYNGHGGGVLETEAGATLVVTNCSFSSCKAEGCGGGVCCAKSVTDCVFTDCQAGQRGGGVERSALTVGCSFSNCIAGDSGGGAKMRHPQLYVQQVQGEQLRRRRPGLRPQGDRRELPIQRLHSG